MKIECLNAPEFVIERVNARVAIGGHNIPEEDGDLVISRDGKIVKVKASELLKTQISKV